MMVTRSQARIDKWLDEQINEAMENGYIPDEAVDAFKGKNDYYLTVSKGNEEEGYDSYGLICKPICVEEE